MINNIFRVIIFNYFRSLILPLWWGLRSVLVLFNVVITTCVKAVLFVFFSKFILIEGRFLPKIPFLGLAFRFIGLGFPTAARSWVLETVAGAMSRNTTMATFACELVLSTRVLTGAASHPFCHGLFHYCPELASWMRKISLPWRSCAVQQEGIYPYKFQSDP